MNANEAQLKNLPGTGTAIAGRDQLAAAGISPGVMKPLNVLVEGGNADVVARKLAAVPGVVGATAPPGWQRGPNSFVEGSPNPSWDTRYAFRLRLAANPASHPPVP